MLLNRDKHRIKLQPIVNVYCEIFELALEKNVTLRFIPYRKLQLLQIPSSRRFSFKNRIYEFLENLLQIIQSKKYQTCKHGW